MSVVSEVILKADDELRYLNGAELEGIYSFLTTGEERLEIANILADNDSKIVQQASKLLFSKHPEYRANGGNASSSKQYNQCLRDYSWYLRLATYGIIAGNIQPIDAIGLVGVKEMYISLNVPLAGMVDAIVFLKEAALGLLSAKQAKIAGPYFDYMAQVMS
ncbi:MAG: allophycocyanin [Synechococcaceae cyanobacterium RL_1_2]|nr:allophycocyanin [Synechococcaceae cyanobacterium RL_1_2]